MKKRVLIVDDESRIRRALSLLLEERGFETVVASGGAEALARLEAQSFALMLCDVAMPGMSGIELLEEARRAWPDLPVIMISAHGELEMAVPAVRAGAYDYLLKPIDEERLFHTIDQALELHRLAHENRTLRQETAAEGELLGQSPCMMRLREEIARAAPSEGRILILGENGVGKEVVARLIHDHSLRRDRPFVKVNSAAIPRDLIESELFGHEAGAFTGATRPRKGKLESADGGTLFLDEIGDMSPEVQARLLRVLATGELERVGGSRPISFDVRLITATNQDLAREIREGRFREDLYHRVAVIPIRVPPLRERGEDILLLARHFLGSFTAGYRRQPPEFAADAEEVLQRYPWPGNVRELRNLMERIAIMHPRPTVTGADLGNLLGATSPFYGGSPAPAEDAPPAVDRRALLEEEERWLLLKTLEECGWRVSLAAARLKIDRTTFHRRMRRLGIERPKG